MQNHNSTLLEKQKDLDRMTKHFRQRHTSRIFKEINEFKHVVYARYANNTLLSISLYVQYCILTVHFIRNTCRHALSCRYRLRATINAHIKISFHIKFLYSCQNLRLFGGKCFSLLVCQKISWENRLNSIIYTESHKKTFSAQQVFILLIK